MSSDEFNESELAAVAAARRKPFRHLSDTEKLLLRKYWRFMKRRSRDGKPGGDARLNREYRKWLQKKGLVQQFSHKTYYRWLREAGSV